MTLLYQILKAQIAVISLIERTVSFGGRPKKENPTETQRKPNKNPTETQRKPNRNLNVNVNENVNVNDNIINNIIEIYNITCTNLPKVIKVTDKRKKAIKELLKIYDLKEYEKICQIANQSNFLTGKNETGWKADFDFTLRPDKALSILEGKYNTEKNEVMQKQFNNHQNRQYDNNFLQDLYINKRNGGAGL